MSKQKGVAQSYRVERASEVVELLIYLYALVRFITDLLDSTILLAKEDPTLPTQIYFSLGLLGFLFLLVLLRNYVVMQSIDRKDYSIAESYLFVNENGGIATFFEKLCRLAIILAVVLTPKHTSGLLQLIVEPPISAVGNFIESWMSGIFGIAHESVSAHQIYHDTLKYYAVVLIGLALLFFVWDLINLLALKHRLGPNPSIVTEEDRPQDSDLFSFLLYLNVYKLHGENADGSPLYVYTRRLNTVDHKRAIENGRLWKIYRSYSPKFFERLLLVLFSLSVIACSVSDSNVIAVAIMALLFASYVFSATRNQGYVSDFLGLIAIPWVYIRTR